jgi:hypothetical protein
MGSEGGATPRGLQGRGTARPRYICLARAARLEEKADLFERHAERLMSRGQVQYAMRERLLATHARRAARSARRHALEAAG